jgi:hypothetical protein
MVLTGRPTAEVVVVEAVGEVVPGLGFGHAGQGVAQRDPLVEGGEGGEFEPPAQGGLAEQQLGEPQPVALGKLRSASTSIPGPRSSRAAA